MVKNMVYKKMKVNWKKMKTLLNTEKTVISFHWLSSGKEQAADWYASSFSGVDYWS